MTKMLIMDNRGLSLTMIGGCLLLFHTLWSEGDAEMVPESSNLPKVEDYFDSFRKLGDSCISNLDCENIMHGVCNHLERTCECNDSHPVAESGNNCYEAVPLNRSCVHDSQCEHATPYAHCSKHLCHCVAGYQMKLNNNGTTFCKSEKRKVEPEVIVDYTMLGILLGMAAMFIVMCVVLRMFSKARFQDQRTIFNSPRLLKISLARKTREDSERRGSRCSVASRQPSIYSGLNIPNKSPTGSQGSDRRSTAGSRRGSIQTPLDVRRTTRNVDQVTVDIRGSSDTPGPKVNKV